MGDTKTTLFLMSCSPGIAQGFGTTLRLAKPGDAVVFIHDGVYFSQGAGRFAETLAEATARGVATHYLMPDLEARGLDAADGAIGYDGLLDLIEKHGNVFS